MWNHVNEKDYKEEDKDEEVSEGEEMAAASGHSNKEEDKAVHRGQLEQAASSQDAKVEADVEQ